MAEPTEVPLRVAVRAEGASTVVSLDGELDLASAERLRPQLLAAVRARPRTLVLDVSGLRFVDASGVSVLLEAQRALARSGGAVVLRRPPRVVRRVVQLLELQDALPEEG